MITNLYCALAAILCAMALQFASGAQPGAINVGSPRYEWRGAVTSPASATGNVEITGFMREDGLVALTLKFRGRTLQSYSYGNKLFITSPDTTWENVPGMRNDETPGEFMDRVVRSVVPPGQQIAQLTKAAGELRNENGALTGPIRPAAAGILVEERRAVEPRKRAELKNGSGNVRIWTTNGVVHKYEFTVRGKKVREGKEEDFAQTTTVEIKPASGPIEVPQRVKEKLGIP